MDKRKALVIDDEQIVLDSVQKILASDNYEVDTVLKGKKGIRAAIKKPYDVVLTDIRMPDIGGLVVLRDIKREKPSVPVVIITGFGTIRSAVQAMRLGAADYIEKPFTPEQLISTVNVSIDNAVEQAPETQRIIHKQEVIKVLERTAADSDFRRKLLYDGSDALTAYDLTGSEMLAIVTGDIEWIEAQIGPLNRDQRDWLESRLGSEIW